MIKPDANTIRALAGAVRQFPDFLRWIEAWRMHELENLPSAVNNAAVAQGRCQVLGELTKFAREAPDHAANLK